jgi:hypothetical protein
MIMSQAEIAAARSALRAGSRRRECWDSAAPVATFPSDVPELVSECAARLRVGAEPGYRDTLVNRLQQCVGNGSYSRPAGAIVDQLLGRLTAAALRL